jgi:long-subunit acyl-CoA synthetase (AMP-forming)
VKELFKTSKGKYVAPAPIENALMLHDDVEQALVSGPAMPQPYGLVVLSEAARARVTGDAEMRVVTRSLEVHLERLNATLDPHEQLEKIVVARDAWSIENGLLTPTMKVKRSAIEEHYASRVEAWYAARERVLWA